MTLVNFLAPKKPSTNPFDPSIRESVTRAVERAQLDADRNGRKLTDEQVHDIVDKAYMRGYRKLQEH